MHNIPHTEATKKLLSLKHKGRTPWNKGKKGLYKWSSESKEKLSQSLKGNTWAKAAALKRWEGHERKFKVYKRSLNPLPRVHKTAEELLARKRFRNQRYKAIKRNSLGSHTFEQWLELKIFYKNMCLCCKRQEPDIKLTEDHIMPLSLGGTDYIENIQPLCQSCNTRKHAKYISYLPSNHNDLILRRKVW